ncbi:MAG TPA: DNA translocase FtsK 4TM domain-containing protein [Zoogloea sp.]|uniref:DNA translocase FtsK n=1 Tax=Zoogloea sp. TaxID=49181 RepID=UPI002C02EBA3|nr:DNA translocase FtsK 4TM domain-containing protein [Zoogloea sp.]HMV18288.1 DNA translocase FtsK 4TM domain-containing protein [Rhodocyclaceae bacterium]HMW50522.1 DNA translocase FtsK 4TM domain-containing protein [Rhodocyclaceae bacterium]HMY50141.1 DNA translocase FtsK 4TM domain-containing protein [Rhodocyclaceae bacterium]HMZ76395.1 DNA translocase FtsK 4TM domain-containing protein [Rhodocyclaceae bacterium]HNA67996.1 DNA translocase FtsK 4TM domain-containing protein [Rhodocyclaceae 
MLNRPSTRPVPLPEKIASLLQEARWLLLGVLAAYLAIVLFGYAKSDPGWSHAVYVERVSNPGGRFGAWLSDLLLYLFGLSAWWWVAFLGVGLAVGFRRLQREHGADRRSLFIVLAGFLVVLVASSGLESMRFHSLRATLPLEPGGLIGVELGSVVGIYLGFTGGTLLLLTLIAAGLSLFSGVSWVEASEAVGGALEAAWNFVLHGAQTWEDRRVGREVAQKREAVVETKRKKEEAAPPPPVRIEPAVVEVPRSERVVKERQAALFVELPGGSLPPLALLDEPADDVEPPSVESLEFTSRLIERKLADFGVEVKVLAAYPGPVITRFEIEPAVGVKGSQVMNLVKDLARALSVVSIRVVETVPGKTCMALELPNPKRQTVRLSEILGSKAYHDMHSPLTVALGKDIGGQPVVADIAKTPHLLVAGTTGSGKSVGINAMILSLLYKSEPEDVRLILVDPKMLELSIYEGIPHLLAPVVTDMKHAGNALNWCVAEMEKRYKLMSSVGVRNLAGYNKAVAEAVKAGAPLKNPFSITPESPEPLEKLPYVVVIIDELADLMMVVGKKIEELIARLAQKARAAGIHLILATQRPSVDVITGLIKANIPTRMAFQVSSKIDSRTILDQMGAEALLGMGDMLYLAPGTGLPTRVHGAFVADHEVHKVVEFLKSTGAPDYVEGILAPQDEEAGDLLGGGEGGEGSEADPLYDQAVEVVLKTRRPSISLVQRHLRIGYNRAARLIEQMERSGVVSAMSANGNRDVIVPPREGE